MSYTNETSKLKLPQWVGTDRPTYLVDFNTAFLNIDNAFISLETEMKANGSKMNSFISTILDNTKDLNNLENGRYSLSTNEDYSKQNRPNKKRSFLNVYSDVNGTYNLLIDEDNNLYTRCKVGNGTWTKWNRYVNESEFKTINSNVDAQLQTINSTINNLNTLLRATENNVSKIQKMDLVSITYNDKGNVLRTIGANKGVHYQLNSSDLSPTSSFDKAKLLTYSPISISAVVAVHNSEKLILHGMSAYRDKETNDLKIDVSIYNPTNEEITFSGSELYMTVLMINPECGLYTNEQYHQD